MDWNGFLTWTYITIRMLKNIPQMQTAFIYGYIYNYKESANRFPAIIDESRRQP